MAATRGTYGSHYDPEEEVLRDRLDRHIALSANMMALVSFGSIFYFKFDIREKLGLSDPSIFNVGEILDSVASQGFLERLAGWLREDGLAVTLFLFTALWYYRYSGAVRRELGIMSTLFAALNPPREYAALTGGRYVPLLALGLTATFIVMTLLSDLFPFFCIAVLLLNILDFHGNAMIRGNLRKFFADPALAPMPEDPEYEFVMARRKIAESYWIERWQLQRILIMAFVTMLGMALYTAPLSLQAAPPPWAATALAVLAHLAVCGAIAWNEILIQGWRNERDRDLRAVNRAQAAQYYAKARDAGGEA